MKITELENIRYSLMDKMYDKVYILSTQKVGFFQKIALNITIRILAFRIHLIDKKIHI